MVAQVLASALAKSEAVNVTRKRVIDQTQQMWNNTDFGSLAESAAASASQCGGGGASASQGAQQQAASFITEGAQKLYDFLLDLLQGATTNIRRTFFGTAGGGAGAHAICSAEAKPGTTAAFTHEQEHFLSGIISFLHNEHTSALEHAQRRTYMLCGVTAAASIAAAVASSYYFFVYRPRQEKMMNKKSVSSSSATGEEESTTNKNKILIRKLNFEGDSDALVSLLARIKNIGSSSSNGGADGGERSFIEIEEACVTNNAASEEDDEDASPYYKRRRNSPNARGVVGQNSTFTIDYYDNASSATSTQKSATSDVVY